MAPGKSTAHTTAVHLVRRDAESQGPSSRHGKKPNMGSQPSSGVRDYSGHHPVRQGHHFDVVPDCRRPADATRVLVARIDRARLDARSTQVGTVQGRPLRPSHASVVEKAMNFTRHSNPRAHPRMPERMQMSMEHFDAGRAIGRRYVPSRVSRRRSVRRMRVKRAKVVRPGLVLAMSTNCAGGRAGSVVTS